MTNEALDEQSSEPENKPNERAARLEKLSNSGPAIDQDSYRKKSRRSFLTFAVGALAAGGGWRWLTGQSTRDGSPEALRRGYEFNEAFWSRISSDGGVPTFELAAATPLRVNGVKGMETEVDLEEWSMTVEGPDGTELDSLDLADVQALSTFDTVVEHKCIEGWSNITSWTGVRFPDFAQKYVDEIGPTDYVSFETPDGEYYVGVDFDVAMHRQSMLVTGLEGEPLNNDHGAPLRLVLPMAYGIKSLKRIGRIRFTNERPADYWAERGYDWYSIH